MTVLTFPSSPQSGDTYSAPNGTLYTYDGVKWVVTTTTVTNNSVTNFVQDAIAPIFENITSDGISFTYNAETNSLSANVTTANTGSITFADINMYGATSMDFPLGGITLVPNRDSGYTDYGQYVDIYPTVGNDAPHIHIAAGTGGLSKGDLILGDDTQYVDINHAGSIVVKSFDKQRGWDATWEFQPNGVLTGPAMGAIAVNGIFGAPAQDLYISGSSNFRNAVYLQFVDADGTEKSTYTVDTNFYNVSSIPTTGGASIWWTNGSALAISSIVLGDGTATFTFSDVVTLAAGTDYLIDWDVPEYHAVVIQTDGGQVRFDQSGETRFPSNKFIQQGQSRTRAESSSFPKATPTVIWSSSADFISSAKLVIQIEADEVGDATGWHSQTCEAIIASRGWANGTNGYGEPAMSVYGVVHTSIAELATFTVQRNPTTRLIEVVATATGTVDNTNLYYSISSVEMTTWD